MMKISLQTPSDPHSRVTGNLQSLHRKRGAGRKEGDAPEKRRDGKKEVEQNKEI